MTQITSLLKMFGKKPVHIKITKNKLRHVLYEIIINSNVNINSLIGANINYYGI